MPLGTRDVPAQSPQPSVASMDMSQAFIGLHLHENFETATALEFFVRGYVGCATTEGIDYQPLNCAEQVLKIFAHHESWGHNGFPWDRLDRNWKSAAMLRLVDHVCDGHSLSEQSVNQAPLPDITQAARGDGGARLSVKEDADEPDLLEKEGSISFYNDDGDDNENYVGPATSIAPLRHKGKVAAFQKGFTAIPASQRLALPYEVPPSSTESPPQLAALERARNKSPTIIVSSSSPLSILPSSIFKPLPAARASTQTRQTRSVTRAASSCRRALDPAVSTASSRQSVRLQQNNKKKQATITSEMLWPFDTILDSRIKDEDVEYKIKWSKGRPTWQPSVDLQGTPEEIDAFHEKYPEKVGPPGWFARAVAKAEAEDE